jgi:glycosyltransferase involved in cell wall biosynthesis
MLRDTEYDILYLNSFFNFPASIFPNFVTQTIQKRRVPVIIAPRGEFSPGSLSQKAGKKRVFLRLAKMFLPYSACYWLATSPIERNYITKTLGIPEERVFIASNIPEFSPETDQLPTAPPCVDPTTLRLIFLSRISPEKNLLFLLQTLRNVKTSIGLNIFGPIQDRVYWQQCQDSIAILPKHVKVEYLGDVEHSQVRHAFRQNDLFVFPSCGENFGPVIFESLSAGTCVVTSDQTPWLTSNNGAITVLSLRDPDNWSNTIDNWAVNSLRSRETYRAHALEFAHDHVKLNQGIREHLQMFRSVALTNNHGSD